MTTHGRRTALILVVPTLAVVLSACAEPEYRYVKNADAGLYLKVPRSWRSFDKDSVIKHVQPNGNGAARHPWQLAFDSAAPPSVDHVFDSDPAQPVAWVFVRDVPPQERDKISLNSLRDEVLPVSTAANQAQTSGEQGDFELVNDEPLNPEKGLYGVRTVFRHKATGETQTVNQTVITNDKHSKLYYLFVRCSTSCYERNRDAISAVVDSFTVRG